MNRKLHVIPALACMALLCGTAAHGQGIWRCGPQGNSFSDRPCTDGQVLAAAPAPSAAAVQEAVEVARREVALADRLRAERLAQEREFVQAQAAGRRGAHRADKPPKPRVAAPETVAQASPSPRSRSAHPGLKTAQPGLRVAAAPAPLSSMTRAVKGPSAVADARTSPSAARGSRASRD